MLSAGKTEPKLDAPPVSPEQPTIVTAPPLPAPVVAVEPAKLDQVSRIEDKVARVEEKFARSEERMMRVESALEKATIRLEGATQDMNLQGLKEDIAGMRAALDKKPGAVSIFLIALVAALIGAGVAFALTRFGIPGVLPR